MRKLYFRSDAFIIKLISDARNLEILIYWTQDTSDFLAGVFTAFQNQTSAKITSYLYFANSMLPIHMETRESSFSLLLPVLGFFHF